MKAAGEIELRGDILAVHIDGERARVLVQENISGQPFSRLWFYRRTDAGWLHTAPDPTFWGERLQYEGAGVRINYRAADQRFAVDLGMALEDWIQRACAVFACGDLPILVAEVRLDAIQEPAWRDERNLRLDVPSPYLDIARADTPFDGVYQRYVSQLLAARVVNAHTSYRTAAYPHDAHFLRQAATDWLAAWLTHTGRSDTLMGSLAHNYGADAIARLLDSLGTTDSMAILQRVIPDPLAQADLHWRDFIEWRIKLESELIGARAEEQWLRLYDTSDEGARRAAYARFNQSVAEPVYRVVDQFVWTGDAGHPQLRVSVEAGDASQPGAENVLFNLVNGVWKRAS